MNKLPEMRIGKRIIGPDQPPFIIGELSANHNGSLDRALEIIDAIAEAGADAVKLQTYTADTMTLDSDREDFQLHEGPWAGRSLYELYEWAYTPWEWHDALFERGRYHGLEVFSSPFDAGAVDFLEAFDPPAYKIASFEIVDLPLIRYVASKARPMIISTGMATRQEIAEAVDAAKAGGCTDLCLLHCTSGYPTPPDEADLRTIQWLQETHETLVGLSDHTLGSVVPIASVAAGAAVVEKHVTLARADGGPDSKFSIEPNELADLVWQLNTAWRAMGKVREEPRESEGPQRSLRRSLYLTESLSAGDEITYSNVRSIRPGYGIAPKFLDDVIGQHVAKDIERGTALTWDIIEQR